MEQRKVQIQNQQDLLRFRSWFNLLYIPTILCKMLIDIGPSAINSVKHVFLIYKYFIKADRSGQILNWFKKAKNNQG